MNRIRAVALLIVMFALAFLMGLVLLVAGSVSQWTDSEIHAEKAFRARQMALSGLAFGRNPTIKPGHPLLAFGSKETEGYEVKITNESGKLNPNYWVALGNREIFIRLFDAWEVPPVTRDAAIDCLIDWIDADDFRLMSGAERQEYAAIGQPNYPPNRPITNVHEMEAILNLKDILAATPGWREDFTVWQNGKINIQYVKTPLLAALTGMTPLQCQTLMELRAGPDGLDDTEDDVKLTSMEDLAATLGVGGAQRAALQQFFDVSGSVLRIESTGYCHGVSHQIVIIARGSGSGGILSWEEQ